MTSAERETRLEKLYAQQEHNRLALEFYTEQIKATRKEIMDLQAPETDAVAQAQTLEVLGHVMGIKEAMMTPTHPTTHPTLENKNPHQPSSIVALPMSAVEHAYMQRMAEWAKNEPDEDDAERCCLHCGVLVDLDEYEDELICFEVQRKNAAQASMQTQQTASGMSAGRIRIAPPPPYTNQTHTSPNNPL